MTTQEFVKKESEVYYCVKVEGKTFHFDDGLTKGLEIAEGFYEFVQDFTLQELAEKTTSELLTIFLTEKYGNNGRDKSDGVGGREVNNGTQETMTKENTAIEILVEHIRVMDLTGFPADWELVNNAIDQSIRELSAERERSGKLVEALKMCRTGLCVCA